MRLIVALTVALTLSLSAPSARTPDVPDPGAPGPYALGHTSFLVVDSSRDTGSAFSGRPVAVNVWYPADASVVTDQTPQALYALDPLYWHWPTSASSEWEQFGMSRAYEGIAASPGKPFPIVLVSPGWGGRYFGLMFYAMRLASHGFVVAVAYHFRDAAYGWEPRDPLDVALLNRPRDVQVMLDALLARNGDSTNALFGSVRPDLVAASGWSLGGYASMALAGGDDEVCTPLDPPCVSLGSTPADPRIKAIVTLDGSNQMLHFSELARITVPAMGIGQAWENVGSWQARQHSAISGHPSYRADVFSAVHQSFSNSCTATRVLYMKGLISAAQNNSNLSTAACHTVVDQREINRLTAKYAIAFLKTQLSGEAGYQDILTPGWALTMEPNIQFFVTEPMNPHALGEDPCCFPYFPHQPGSQTARAERDPLLRPAVEHVDEW